MRLLRDVNSLENVLLKTRDRKNHIIDKVAKIVEHGSSWIGTELGTCSPEFRELFECSKLIISKVQANFETLSDVGGNIYFILRAKCEEVAAELGVQLRDIVIANSNMLRKQRKQSETI